MPFWNYHTLAQSTLGWEINENESLKDYGANCRIEIYGNHLEKFESEFACLCLPLITFARLCTFAYLSLPLLLTDFVTQRILRLIGVLSHTKR